MLRERERERNGYQKKLKEPPRERERRKEHRCGERVAVCGVEVGKVCEREMR